MNYVPIQVFPVIDYSVRALCINSYHLHPKGCPNFTKCDRCPPKAKLYDQVYDLSQPVYAVINEFNYGEHVAKMLATPKKNGKVRSLDEAKCVLYWQNSARKQLDIKIKSIGNLYKYVIEKTPEAMGVNITATLENIGIKLEWPPVNVARQIALLAIPKGV